MTKTTSEARVSSFSNTIPQFVEFAQPMVMPIKKPKNYVAVISASAERGHCLEDVPVKHKILTALRESMSPMKIETVINLQFPDRFFYFFLLDHPTTSIFLFFHKILSKLCVTVTHCPSACPYAFFLPYVYSGDILLLIREKTIETPRNFAGLWKKQCS